MQTRGPPNSDTTQALILRTPISPDENMGARAQGWVRTERKLATLRACGAPGGSQEELARTLRRRVRLIMNTGA